MESKQSIRPELLNAAAYLNNYSPFIPWSQSIGCKTNMLKHSERYRSSLLAEEFLLNSYYTRGDRETDLSVELFYDEASIAIQALHHHRDYSHLPKIILPDGVALDIKLGEAILRRRSVRQFTGDAITLDYLATVARAACGVSGTAMARLRQGDELKLNFCTVSSAGHLYPIEIYFAVLNVKDLDKGVYLYSSRDDALFKVGDHHLLTEIFSSFSVNEEYSAHLRANYMCLFAAHPWKTMCKYGNRGLRFALQEIGAVTQNIHLANVCLGLGSIDWGGYFENEVNKAMGFDGVNQSVLHILFAGIVG